MLITLVITKKKGLKKMENGKKTRIGYYSKQLYRKMSDIKNFIPERDMIDGQLYEIVNEYETSFGKEFLLQTKKKKRIRVPAEVIVEFTGNVYLSISTNPISLFKDNEVLRVKITKKPSVFVKEKIIHPVRKDNIGSNICYILSTEGDLYCVYLAYANSIKDNNSCYIGKSFDLPPKVAKPFEFISVNAYNRGNKKPLLNLNRIRLNPMAIKEIGDNFYEISGIVKKSRKSNYIKARIQF